MPRKGEKRPTHNQEGMGFSVLEETKKMLID